MFIASISCFNILTPHTSICRARIMPIVAVCFLFFLLFHNIFEAFSWTSSRIMIAEVNTESKIFMLKEYVDIWWNHVYTIDKKDIIYDLWPFRCILIQNLKKRVFHRSLLSFNQAVCFYLCLQLIRTQNPLFNIN